MKHRVSTTYGSKAIRTLFQRITLAFVLWAKLHFVYCYYYRCGVCAVCPCWYRQTLALSDGELHIFTISKYLRWTELFAHQQWMSVCVTHVYLIEPENCTKWFLELGKLWQRISFVRIPKKGNEHIRTDTDNLTWNRHSATFATRTIYSFAFATIRMTTAVLHANSKLLFGITFHR